MCCGRCVLRRPELHTLSQHHHYLHQTQQEGKQEQYIGMPFNHYSEGPHQSQLKQEGRPHHHHHLHYHTPTLNVPPNPHQSQLKQEGHPHPRHHTPSLNVPPNPHQSQLKQEGHPHHNTPTLNVPQYPHHSPQLEQEGHPHHPRYHTPTLNVPPCPSGQMPHLGGSCVTHAKTATSFFIHTPPSSLLPLVPKSDVLGQIPPLPSERIPLDKGILRFLPSSKLSEDRIQLNIGVPRFVLSSSPLEVPGQRPPLNTDVNITPAKKVHGFSSSVWDSGSGEEQLGKAAGLESKELEKTSLHSEKPSVESEKYEKTSVGNAVKRGRLVGYGVLTNFPKSMTRGEESAEGKDEMFGRGNLVELSNVDGGRDEEGDDDDDDENDSGDNDGGSDDNGYSDGNSSDNDSGDNDGGNDSGDDNDSRYFQARTEDYNKRKDGAHGRNGVTRTVRVNTGGNENNISLIRAINDEGSSARLVGLTDVNIHRRYGGEGERDKGDQFVSRNEDGETERDITDQLVRRDDDGETERDITDQFLRRNKDGETERDITNQLVRRDDDGETERYITDRLVRRDDDGETERYITDRFVRRNKDGETERRADIDQLVRRKDDESFSSEEREMESRLQSDTGRSQFIRSRPQFVRGQVQSIRPQFVRGQLQSTRPQFVRGQVQSTRPQFVRGQVQSSRPQFVRGQVQSSRPQFVRGRSGSDKGRPKVVRGRLQSARVSQFVRDDRDKTLIGNSGSGFSDANNARNLFGNTGFAGGSRNLFGNTGNVGINRIGNSEDDLAGFGRIIDDSGEIFVASDGRGGLSFIGEGGNLFGNTGRIINGDEIQLLALLNLDDDDSLESLEDLTFLRVGERGLERSQFGGNTQLLGRGKSLFDGNNQISASNSPIIMGRSDMQGPVGDGGSRRQGRLLNVNDEFFDSVEDITFAGGTGLVGGNGFIGGDGFIGGNVFVNGKEGNTIIVL
ncbi:hypothetical protein Pmani_005897 [Petrolisthes manimaculis]|uniref:Uncharacterized protein n=1 Tax=Petrolisthes manimaculis TaxID=1843537 RepID=A0AAE1UG94_9EUCA|nr:hypothetical protein Pmani_005897 [Petrolisthes manimaculis]